MSYLSLRRLIALCVILILIVSCSYQHEDKFFISNCDPKDHTCIDNDEIITSYRVDIKANKVLSIINFPKRDNYKSSVIWGKENCLIFDDKNWDCKADSPNGIPLWQNKMVDGNLILATSYDSASPGKVKKLYIKKLGLLD